MDYLVHIANLLYLASYVMRDLIRLRVLTVVAASCLIPYLYLQPKVGSCGSYANRPSNWRTYAKRPRGMRRRTTGRAPRRSS